MPAYTQTNQMPLAFHLILAGLAALLMVVLVGLGGTNGLWPVMIGLGFVFGLSALFSKMTVNVSEKGVSWFFTGKMFGGFIPMAEIREVEVTYMGWQVGYGHRWTRRGILYRAWGLDVVQIHREKGKPVFLGAEDASAMVKAIEAMQEKWLESP